MGDSNRWIDVCFALHQKLIVLIGKGYFVVMIGSMNENENSLVSLSIYNKSTLITNCNVEIWENTETGDISVGWYRTEDSEEFNNE